MNKTQSFEKLDKLAEGLRGLSELPDKEREKAPAMQKWKSALDALPKKDREEYKQQKYDESVKDKEWQEQQKYKKLFEKEIRPNTKIVYFWLGEGVVKERKLLQEKEAIKERFVSEDESKKEIFQDIKVPEIVDIDYSEIKDIPVAKYGGALKPYKDGFLIVRDDNPKIYHNFEISNYVNQSNTESKMFFHSLMVKDNCHYYLRADDVEKVKDHKNNLNLYFVYKRAYKNKAFKITLKNNKYFAHIFKCFEKDKSTLIKKEQIVLDIVSSLPSDLITNYLESLGTLERYETLKDVKESERSRGEKEFLEKEYLSMSNEKILKAGYYFSILSKFLSLIAQLKAILSVEEKNKTKKEDFNNTILRPFIEIESKDNKLLTKVLLESIEKSNVGAKDIIPVVKDSITAKRRIKKEGITDVAELTLNILNLLILYSHTEKGTSLPLTGKIDVKEATEIDCFYYWGYLSLFNLVNGCLDKADFPLFLEEGKIFNENEFYKHVHEAKKSVGESPFRNPNETFNLDAETKAQISEILTEAMDQTTGLLIPHNACIEIKDDPMLKYIRFIEYEKYIAIFAHDQKDRFIPEIYVKGEKEFRYWLYNSGQVFDSKITESSKLIYLKIAACIRDWKVLIERDSTMQVRPRPMIPQGVKTNKKRWIYLPRVTYKHSETREQKSREKIFFNESRKFSGDRREHRRKLPSGMKASKTQLILAKDANFYIPEGHTFVKKSIWGKIKMGQREIRYRNTSLNGLFYASDAEVKKVKEIHELSPAGFEEHSEKYVAKLGWEVRKRNNYDGGIDIRALRDAKEGVEQLFVQCKHWKKPIGPDVLRELVGSATDEENEYKKVLMVITSSRFTPGAVDYADRNDIILVDGDDLLK